MVPVRENIQFYFVYLVSFDIGVGNPRRFYRALGALQRPADALTSSVAYFRKGWSGPRMAQGPHHFGVATIPMLLDSYSTWR